MSERLRVEALPRTRRAFCMWFAGGLVCSVPPATVFLDLIVGDCRELAELVPAQWFALFALAGAMGAWANFCGWFGAAAEKHRASVAASPRRSVRTAPFFFAPPVAAPQGLGSRLLSIGLSTLLVLFVWTVVVLLLFLLILLPMAAFSASPPGF